MPHPVISQDVRCGGLRSNQFLSSQHASFAASLPMAQHPHPHSALGPEHWDSAAHEVPDDNETEILQRDHDENQTTWGELEDSNPDRAPLSLVHAHSKRPLPTDAVDRPEVENVDDFGRSIYHSQFIGKVPAASDDATLLEPLEHQRDLGTQLRNALCELKKNQEFLPLDSLDDIVNIRNVYHELGGSSAASVSGAVNADVKRRAVEICQSSTPRRAIFAILVLTGKAQSIGGFVRCKVWDHHLPFRIEWQKEDDFYAVTDSRNERVPKACFAGWKDSDYDPFEKQQWLVLAPYFAFGRRSNGKPLHYNLDPDYGSVRLPFLEREELESGGFSEVARVCVHPAHCPSEGPAPKKPETSRKVLVAVKTLQFTPASSETRRAGSTSERGQCYEKTFYDEVLALDRCSSKSPHIIQLLLTYRHGNRYHLVFPWAHCNMLKYWQREFPDKGYPERNRQFATWVASQFLAIAEGLKTIHFAEPRPSGKDFGRHGDLKPANILWFRGSDAKGESGGADFGRFVISDLGLTRFHNARSKNKVDARVIGRTDTYRPPECDVGFVVSPKFDIWTLGCVFLEFCCWYSAGWERVDEFSQQRANEEEGAWGGHKNYKEEGIAGDTFFLPPHKSRTKSNSNPARKVAQLKKSVFEVSQKAKLLIRMMSGRGG